MRGQIVEVVVSGGFVQRVSMPQGVSVIVRDYDTIGCDGYGVLIDDDGNEYTETLWTDADESGLSEDRLAP